MIIVNYNEARKQLFRNSNFVNPKEVKYKINAEYLRFNCWNAEECYRELMVSFFQMLPLIEKEVNFYEADYILYAHPYARLEDMSPSVLEQIHWIDRNRKKGAEIIVVGKATNIKPILDDSISNITFYNSHFTETLGKRFEMNIKDEYMVYDSSYGWLNIWTVNGCLKKCKFCRRTYMHIPFESISLETIKSRLDRIKVKAPELMECICLRAENLTEYGVDVYGEQRLQDLIRLIDSYEEVKYISLFPIGLAICEITDEILESICNIKKNVTSIALNLEAGSNRILKLIEKNHTRERAIYIFKELRKAHPKASIHTGVMVGFPTEELKDIYELADLIEQTDPNHIFCNLVEIAPKCPLAELPQLSDNLREYHLKVLLGLLKRQKREHEANMSYPKIFKKGKRSTYIFKKESEEYLKRFSLLTIPRKELVLKKH